jgi:transcriptional regulator with XRE-family HTH domain
MEAMKSDDPKAMRWRELLDQALDDARMTRAELGRRIGRTAAQVSQWVAGHGRYAPPDPDVVFEIEDVLGCRDMLSSTLGYVRADDVRPTPERAIEADEELLPVQKETLLVQLESSRRVARAQRRQRRRPPV